MTSNYNFYKSYIIKKSQIYCSVSTQLSGSSSLQCSSCTYIANSFHYNTHCPSVWLWLICTVSIELITPGLRPMTSNSQYISEQCIAMLWGYPQLCGDNGPPGGHLRPERVMYATELILVINIHNMQRNCIVIAFCLLRESNMFDYFGEEDVGLNW